MQPHLPVASRQPGSAPFRERSGQNTVSLANALYLAAMMPIRHPPPNIDQFVSFADRIADTAATVRRWQIQAIRYRAAPVWPSVDPNKAVLNPHNAANIAGVAVRVKTRRIDDHHGFLKVVAIEQRKNYPCMVRHDMAIAWITITAIFAVDLPQRLAPVRLPGVPVAYLLNHPVGDRTGGDQGRGGVDQLIDVRFDKGLSF